MILKPATYLHRIISLIEACQMLLLVNISNSYCGHTGFVVFLSPSKKMVGECFKTDHERLYLHIFERKIQSVIRCYLVCAAEESSLNKRGINHSRIKCLQAAFNMEHGYLLGRCIVCLQNGLKCDLSITVNYISRRAAIASKMCVLFRGKKAG